VGIIGAGEIVSRSHFPVLKVLSSARIAWITDVNDERAKALASAFGVSAIALPDQPAHLPECDVILLAIPYGARAPYYAALRDRSCAFYVEKPFATTTSEHQSLCAMRTPSHIACGLQRRSLTSVKLMQSLIRNEMLGSLQRVEFGLGRRGHIRSGTYHSNVAVAGGGALLEVGVHGIDALLFMTDAQDARIESASVVTSEGFDVHVDASVQIRSSGDRWTPARITVSGLEDSIEGFKFYFERGEIFFSIFQEQAHVIATQAGQQYVISLGDSEQRIASQYQTAFAYWAAFLEGLGSGNPNWTSALDSLLTTKIVEEIYAQPARSLS
jgi:predicted dehydrogenase